MIKNFKITERQELRFTTDFFNIWNHANFANPAFTDVEGGSFGKNHQYGGSAAANPVLAAVCLLIDRVGTSLEVGARHAVPLLISGRSMIQSLKIG